GCEVDKRHMTRSWDVFCAVVDNFGDVGVTWRLARQLVEEQGQRVRLWIDDLSAFARLCPEADAGLARQTLHGVEVCRWAQPWTDADPAGSVPRSRRRARQADPARGGGVPLGAAVDRHRPRRCGHRGLCLPAAG